MPNWIRDDGTSCFNDETKPLTAAARRARRRESVPQRLGKIEDLIRALPDVATGFAHVIELLHTELAAERSAHARTRERLQYALAKREAKR